ncbi:hypothetical protein OJAV_G00186360 [Oryzias javanicus]|uniref:Uncharacterized protein n=1 Tax=Oryzias javanicus TaxID=123683 RepID=A0A437C8Y5_ORYJA|nr:hypothetical protein OJAV_G00186360 [Oryzias javanicus]
MNSGFEFRLRTEQNLWREQNPADDRQPSEPITAAENVFASDRSEPDPVHLDTGTEACLLRGIQQKRAAGIPERRRTSMIPDRSS